MLFEVIIVVDKICQVYYDGSMKLSTRGRYAASAMFDMACYAGGEPITAAVIAERQKISLTYLEQLLNRLRKSGLVETVRGPSGGYLLARKPSQISIGDVVRAADGPIALADCVGKATHCHKSGCCSTRSLWKTLSNKVSKVLDSTTLADLCKEAKR